MLAFIVGDVHTLLYHGEKYRFLLFYEISMLIRNNMQANIRFPM